MEDLQFFFQAVDLSRSIMFFYKNKFLMESKAEGFTLLLIIFGDWLENMYLYA